MTNASRRPRLNASPNATAMPLFDSLASPAVPSTKRRPLIVQVQLLRAVVVREVDVGPAVLVEVGRRGGERPARAADPHAIGDVLELAAAEVAEEQVLPAVVGELEAVVHDPRRREVPQIDVAPEVRGDVQVEQPVAIVVEPDRAVAVDPAAQAGGFA